MPATVHLICGPAGSGKTRRLLERAVAARAAPGAALWLAPTIRCALRIEEKLASAGFRVLTFQDLADEIVAANDPAARPLSRAQRRLIVDAVVADLTARGKLPHFSRVIETRGFAEGMLALLEELKRREVRPEELTRAASGEKDRQCAEVYAHYQERLDRDHLFDPEGRLWRARDLLAAGNRRPFGGLRLLIVDDFAGFTRTELDILGEVARACEEVWIALPDDIDEERAELFAAPRATRARLEGLRPQVEYLRHAPASGGRQTPVDTTPRGANAPPRRRAGGGRPPGTRPPGGQTPPARPRA